MENAPTSSQHSPDPPRKFHGESRLSWDLIGRIYSLSINREWTSSPNRETGYGWNLFGFF